MPFSHWLVCVYITTRNIEPFEIFENKSLDQIEHREICRLDDFKEAPAPVHLDVSNSE